MAFHHYAQIIRKICTSLPVRSSTLLSKGFNLSRHRSTGFGFPTNDSRRAHLVPHILRCCGHLVSLRLRSFELSLAIDQNSLARYSKRTIRHWSALRLRPFHAVSEYGCLVSRSFDLPSRVLFSFHSRYYCAIGLETYLELETNVSQLHARYPTHVTQEHRQSSFRLVRTGLSPSLVLRSSRFLVDRLRSNQVHNTTSPLHFCEGFSLLCAAFDRLY